MFVLGLDTTMAACSAAVYDAARDRVLARRFECMERGHAEALAPMAEQVMAEAGIVFKDLARIAVTTGPGTFTGVRIGLAMARGFAVALGIPVIGVNSLKALALNVEDGPDGLPVAVIVDARRGGVYVQVFAADGSELTEPHCVCVAALADVLPSGGAVLIGSGAGFAGAGKFHLSKAIALPDAARVATFAATVDAPDRPPVPLYLRPADAKPQAAKLKFEPVKVEVHEADAAYAGVLAALHKACFATAWDARALAEMLKVPGTRCWLALSGDREQEPAGFVMTRGAAGEAEIITICVLPASRRRHIGQTLLAAAAEALKVAGTENLFLEVEANNVAARALYTHLGFSETGIRKGYYKHDDGSTSNAVMMGVKLVDNCA